MFRFTENSTFCSKILRFRNKNPILESHSDIELYASNEIVEKSDLLVFLVAHSEFRNIKTFNKEVLNLCGLKLDS